MRALAAVVFEQDTSAGDESEFSSGSTGTTTTSPTPTLPARDEWGGNGTKGATELTNEHDAEETPNLALSQSRAAALIEMYREHERGAGSSYYHFRCAAWYRAKDAAAAIGSTTGTSCEPREATQGAGPCRYSSTSGA